MMTSDYGELQWSVAGRPMPGEELSGDNYLVVRTPTGWLLAVVDGLGHGPEAAAAGSALISTFVDHVEVDLVQLVRFGHEALKGTRGCACALAAIDSRQCLLGWIGIGNVEGVVHRIQVERLFAEYITMRGGIVGYRLPNLQPTFVNLDDGDLLVMATDGINSDFVQMIAGRDPERLSASILNNYAKSTDDALVLVACWRPQAGRQEDDLK